jgi:hypothetical protein
MGIEQKEVMPELNFVNTTIKNSIDFIIANMPPTQQKIFYTLASTSDVSIETALYKQLKDKCCYVFPVATSDCSGYMAIVSTYDSADDSFTPVVTELEMLQSMGMKKVFPITSLHAGIIIPEYTNCAIDAPLKHSFSLSNIAGIGLPSSTVYVTAVTQVDAAAQQKKNSTIYREPVCIPIPVNNLKAGFSFTYEFVYSSIADESNQKLIIDGNDNACENKFSELKDYNKEFLCNYFNKTKKDFFELTFFTGKTNSMEINNKLGIILYNFLKDIYEPRGKSLVDVDKSTCEKIKKMFITLIQQTTIVNADTSDKENGFNYKNTNRPDKDKIIEAKLVFINEVNKFKPNTPQTNPLKANIYLWFLIRAFVNIINATSSYNISEEEKKTLEKQAETSQLLSSNVAVTNNMSGGNQPASNTQDQNTITNSVPTDIESNQIDTTSVQMDVDNNEVETTTPQQELYSDNYDYDNDDDYVNTHSEMAEPFQLSYNNMFGKYGFKMDINEENEFVLTPLDTLSDYVEYLIEYNLVDKIEIVKKNIVDRDNYIKQTGITQDDYERAFITMNGYSEFIKTKGIDNNSIYDAIQKDVNQTRKYRPEKTDGTRKIDYRKNISSSYKNSLKKIGWKYDNNNKCYFKNIDYKTRWKYCPQDPTKVYNIASVQRNLPVSLNNVNIADDENKYPGLKQLYETLNNMNANDIEYNNKVAKEGYGNQKLNTFYVANNSIISGGNKTIRRHNMRKNRTIKKKH